MVIKMDKFLTCRYTAHEANCKLERFHFVGNALWVGYDLIDKRKIKLCDE